jgi:hypothetical protein
MEPLVDRRMRKRKDYGMHNQPTAFISYMREDEIAIRRLATDLSFYGVHTWIDRNDIVPGTPWKDAILGAIADGGFFLACISTNFNIRKQSYMREEINVAVDLFGSDLQGRVIPLLLSGDFPQETVAGEFDLRSLQAIDLRENWEEGVARLATTLHGASVRDQAEIAALRAKLNSENPSQRAAAAIELLKYAQHPAAFPLLEKGLSDSSLDVANAMVTCLRMTGPRGLPILVRALKSANDFGHYAALAMHASLWEGESQELVEQLILDLERDDVLIRSSAVGTLGKRAKPGDGGVPALRRAISEVKIDSQDLIEALKGNSSKEARTFLKEILDAEKAIDSFMRGNNPTQKRIARFCELGPVGLCFLATDRFSVLHTSSPEALTQILEHFGRQALPALTERLRQNPDEYDELLPYIRQLASVEDAPRLERVMRTLVHDGTNLNEPRRAIKRLLKQLSTERGSS